MDDIFDDFEALALGLPPPRKGTETKQQPKQPENITPLVAIFQEKSIRILGTVEDPLFSAADVAAHIDDANYARKIAKYVPGEYMQLMLAVDAGGVRKRPMQYLTEYGLYKYLTQAKGPKAEDFQRFVYYLLKEERKRTVDSIQLALRIAKTQLEESRREQEFLKREQSGLLTAVNTARGTVAKLTRANKTLQNAKNAAADAEEMRRMGRRHLVPGWDDEE